MPSSPTRAMKPDRFGLVVVLIIDLNALGLTIAFMDAAGSAPWKIGLLLFGFVLVLPLQLAATLYVQGQMREVDENQ